MAKRKSGQKVIKVAELEVGDVFCILEKPEKVIGEIFKVQRSKHYRRLMCKNGVNVFLEIEDVFTKDFFKFEFADFQVALLGKHQPKNIDEEPFKL